MQIQKEKKNYLGDLVGGVTDQRLFFERDYEVKK